MAKQSIRYATAAEISKLQSRIHEEVLGIGWMPESLRWQCWNELRKLSGRVGPFDYSRFPASQVNAAHHALSVLFRRWEIEAKKKLSSEGDAPAPAVRQTIDFETRDRLKHFMSVLNTLPIGGVPDSDCSSANVRERRTRKARKSWTPKLQLVASEKTTLGVDVPYVFSDAIGSRFGRAANEGRPESNEIHGERCNQLTRTES